MTTARQLYESVLVELNKTEAPSMLLEDFNYFANKAIYQYINKRYNVYDANQQTSDDVRVLKSSASLEAKPSDDKLYLPSSITESLKGFENRNHKATYEVVLPNDYLHILNCICYFKVHKTHKCHNKGDVAEFPAIRTTADMYPLVVQNLYMRPSYRRPYYYIHNVNINENNPTNPYNEGTSKGTDISSATSDEDHVTKVIGGLPNTINVGENKVDAVEREGQIRFGNKSQVRMEIRYGKDNSVFELAYVVVDYLKTPQHIRLTQEQIDLTEDTSQTLEFPDNVCQEIANELTHIILENSSDPRMQSHPVFSQSIAPPQQEGQQQPKGGK